MKRKNESTVSVPFMSRRLYSRITNTIKQLEVKYKKIVPIKEIIKPLIKMGYKQEEIKKAISRSKSYGDLIEPIEGHIKLL